MDKFELLSKLINLYDSYGVDKSLLINSSLEDILKGTKGHLAKLDKEKNRNYSIEDANIIKDIYFLFC